MNMGSKKFWLIAGVWPLVCGTIYAVTYIGSGAIFRAAEWVGKQFDEEG